MPGMVGSFMRLRIPTARTYQRQLTSSPRSVRIRHRATSSSHSARVTPVWKRASSTRSNRSAIASRWSPDLLAEGVPLGRDVVELLEHREVDVRLDVAHHARVAVPVPGAPDAARLVDDADPLDAGLAEVGAGEDAGDPPAHDHDIDVVGDRVALDDRRERVVTVAGEVLVGPQVADVGPAGDQPLVALGEVLGADGLGVVARGRWMEPRHVATLGQVWRSASGAGSSRTLRLVRLDENVGAVNIELGLDGQIEAGASKIRVHGAAAWVVVYASRELIALHRPRTPIMDRPGRHDR